MHAALVVHVRRDQRVERHDRRPQPRRHDREQQRIGEAPADAEEADPRVLLARARGYLKNNAERMKYPEYRKAGLPVTSSWIESLIKEINYRIKGTEKFWRHDSGEAVLQLRADTLSDTQPLTAFWRRWQSQQTGSNRYQIAT